MGSMRTRWFRILWERAWRCAAIRTRRVYEAFMRERTPDFSNIVISGDRDPWVAQYEYDWSNGFE